MRGHAGGGGRHGQAGDVDTGLGADKLDLIAVFAVAGDLDVVGRAHTGQAANGGAQQGDHFEFGGVGADLHHLVAAAVAEGQVTHKVGRHFQGQLGVDLDGGGTLGRDLDATVDVDQQVLHLQGQAVKTDHAGGASRGLQAGEVTRGVIGVADQGQAKVDRAQAQAFGVGAACVDTRECIHAMATHGDEVGVLDDRAIGQGDSLRTLLQGKAALDGEEAKQVDV